MSGDGEFLAAVEPLRAVQRAGKDVRCSRELRPFHDLAVALGMEVLAGFRQFDDDTRRDLIRDLIATKLDLLVGAENPRSYFVVAIIRRARGELRRRARQARPVDPTRLDDGELHAGHEPADHAFVMDARALLDSASPRDRAIATAVGYGEQPEAIGKQYGISAAAVYKVVSRLRERKTAGGS